MAGRGPMGSMAYKRLLQEYRSLQENPPDGISAGPLDAEKNFFVWEACILGPPDSAYEGGFFTALLTFPPDYPINPFQMRFTSQMWHPNVYPDGSVCISILHAPGEDPNQYERPEERWSPVQSVASVLLSVVSMLSEPNDESPANIDAAKMWREDRDMFCETVLKTVEKSLKDPK